MITWHFHLRVRRPTVRWVFKDEDTLRDVPNVGFIKWGCWDEPTSAGNKACVPPGVGGSKREGTGKGSQVALPGPWRVLAR